MAMRLHMYTHVSHHIHVHIQYYDFSLMKIVVVTCQNKDYVSRYMHVILELFIQKKYALTVNDTKNLFDVHLLP